MTTTSEVTAVSTSTLSQADELLNSGPVTVDLPALVNALPREKAVIVAGMFKKISPNSVDGDADTTWTPTRIKVATGKNHDELEDSRKGDFYNPDLKGKVTKPLTMFPLYSHTTLTKWAELEGDEKGALASSIDGVTIKDNVKGSYFDVSELPVKPGRYVSKKNTGYEYAKTLFFVDKDFTNIYKLILKSYGLGECYDPLTTNTKFNTNYDPTCHKKWFSLGSKEVKHPYGISHVFTAGLSEEDMSEDDVNMVLFFKECARKYHEHQLKERDLDRENVIKLSAEIESKFESTVDTTATDTEAPAPAGTSFDNF